MLPQQEHIITNIDLKFLCKVQQTMWSTNSLHSSALSAYDIVSAARHHFVIVSWEQNEHWESLPVAVITVKILYLLTNLEFIGIKQFI